MRVAFLFLSLLFLLSACTQQTPEGEEIPTSCPPLCAGGSIGVVTEINAPQDEGNVYVGDRLAVSATLTDLGEASVDDGLVCITGLDGSIFSGLGGCTCENFYITLDDSDDAQFEKTRVSFTPTFIPEEASGDHYLTFYSRYSYTSYGPFTLCLTGDPFDEETCSLEGNKLLGSSSGPLQITSLTEELASVGGNAVTLRVRIEAEFAGEENAQLVELDETYDPSCLLTNDDQKTSADVSLILFGESHDCGSMIFDFGESTASATCKIENLDTERFIGGQTEYEGWIQIDYGYQEIQSVSFDVVSE